MRLDRGRGMKREKKEKPWKDGGKRRYGTGAVSKAESE